MDKRLNLALVVTLLALAIGMVFASAIPEVFSAEVNATYDAAAPPPLGEQSPSLDAAVAAIANSMRSRDRVEALDMTMYMNETTSISTSMTRSGQYMTGFGIASARPAYHLLL